MTPKRLKQPTIGAAVLAAVALGGSAFAAAATAASAPPSPAAAAVPSSAAAAAPLTAVGGGSGPRGAVCPTVSSREVYLTDHERYVRHHRRLASFS